jgi:hypothetical protein
MIFVNPQLERVCLFVYSSIHHKRPPLPIDPILGVDLHANAPDQDHGRSPQYVISSVDR